MRLPLNILICKRPKGTKLLVMCAWDSFGVCVCVYFLHMYMLILLSMPQHCDCLSFSCFCFSAHTLDTHAPTGSHISTIHNANKKVYIHKKYLHLKLVSNQIDTNHSQLLLLFHLCSFVRLFTLFSCFQCSFGRSLRSSFVRWFDLSFFPARFVRSFVLS